MLAKNSLKNSYASELKIELPMINLAMQCQIQQLFKTTISYKIAKQFQNAMIRITNNNGATVLTVGLTSQNGEITFNASSFKQGTYQYTLILDRNQVDNKALFGDQINPNHSAIGINCCIKIRGLIFQTNQVFSR